MNRWTTVGRASVTPVGEVERVPGRGEQVAREPPRDQQAADRDAALRLGELRVHERLHDGVRQIRADQRAHRARDRVLGLMHRARADQPLRESERRPDRDRRRDERQHREEGHLRRVTGGAMPDRAAGDALHQWPEPIRGLWPSP
jgi:hypothetical protein